MNKMFLATSFSGHVDYETGQVNPDYKKHIEEILVSLRKTGGFTVFCAVEHEGWLINNDVPPEVGVEKDLSEIDKSDVVLALLPTGLTSVGLQYEIAHAAAIGKKVILASEIGSELSYFNQGVVNLDIVQHLEFENPDNLAEQARVFSKPN